MNNAAQSHPLEQFSMHELLDWKMSYQACKQLLCNYCEQWRNNRKENNPRAGKHGGVTANTRALAAALLRILPPAMEWIRANRSGVYKTCIKTGLYAMMTSSAALQKMMAERKDGDETPDNDVISRSTLFELLKTLEAAGVIHSRKNVPNPMDGGKRSILLYINPAAIVTYPLTKNFEPAEHVTDESNENLQSTASPGPTETIVQFSDYYNASIQSIENINNTTGNVEKVSPIGDDISKEAEKVRSTEVKTPVNLSVARREPGALLWAACAALLYDSKNFGIDTQEQATQLLAAHYEATLEFLKALRADAIGTFCRSNLYLAKAPKAKPALLKWFVEKQLYPPLRDCPATAYALCLDAMRMQAQSCQKHGYKSYTPLVFLSQAYGFEKKLGIVKADIVRESSTNIIARSENIRVKTTMRGWLGAFAALASKDLAFATLQVDNYVKKATDLLLPVQMELAVKQNYLQYFKKEMISLLQKK